MDALLKVEDLTVEYPTPRGWLRALDGVSFAVPAGRALGLVGESGSGKTTAALAVIRLLSPAARIVSGRIQFRGEEILTLPEARLRGLRGRHIGFVFQDPLTALNPSLTLGEQIVETLQCHLGLARSSAVREGLSILAKVGMPDPETQLRVYPHQLSGGMQQRALIAIAISCRPDLVILDEPTTALDVTIEAQILDLLESLRASEGLTVLYISHNLGVIFRVCDEVCVLYAGQVVERGPTRDVLPRPGHPYTKGLLASLPRIDLRLRQERLTPIGGSFPDLVAPPGGCIFHPRCPYAVERCRTEPQVLQPAGAGREVRCFKHGELFQQPWPSETVAAGVQAGPADGEILRLDGLVKEYGRGGPWAGLFGRKRFRAVDGVSFTVRRGEIFGLVGESGCGKTTLARCVVRLLAPTSGQILLKGCDVAWLSEEALRPFRRQAQIVFQNPDSSLNPRKTVAEIIGRPLALFGLASGPALRRRIDELIETVQLPAHYGHRYPHELSGGEKQRVGIARALAVEPEFIVCDEPVTALDVSVQAAILNLLRNLRDALKVSYLFIAHDLSVIANMCDRVAVMYRGRLCEIGRIEEIFRPPYHPYTHALLSAIPIPDEAWANRPRVRLAAGPVRATLAAPGCPFADRCPVKIGPVCDEETPPWLEPMPGHRIACHHPLEVLAALPPAVPLAESEGSRPIGGR